MVYDCASEENKHKLDLIEHSTCRAILKEDRYAHIDDIYKTLGLLRLPVRRTLHLSFLCYKNATDESASLHEFFIPVARVRTRVTRNSATKAVKVPNYDSALCRNAISYRGPHHWNGVSALMRLAETFKSFKRLVSCNLCIAN